MAGFVTGAWGVGADCADLCTSRGLGSLRRPRRRPPPGPRWLTATCRSFLVPLRPPSKLRPPPPKSQTVPSLQRRVCLPAYFSSSIYLISCLDTTQRQCRNILIYGYAHPSSALYASSYRIDRVNFKTRVVSTIILRFVYYPQLLSSAPLICPLAR